MSSEPASTAVRRALARGTLWDADGNPVELPALSVPDRFVWIVVASYADPDGANAYPSGTTVAGITGLDPRSVYRSLRRLRDVGLLERVPGDDGKPKTVQAGGTKRTYVYRVPVNKCRPPAGVGTESPNPVRAGSPNPGGVRTGSPTGQDWESYNHSMTKREDLSSWDRESVPTQSPNPTPADLAPFLDAEVHRRMNGRDGIGDRNAYARKLRTDPDVRAAAELACMKARPAEPIDPADCPHPTWAELGDVDRCNQCGAERVAGSESWAVAS